MFANIVECEVRITKYGGGGTYLGLFEMSLANSS
jgi:hypothetical protein